MAAGLTTVSLVNRTTVPPIVIFPFPVPPPGFPTIPPGTPQPKKQCPTVPEKKCSECGGKNHWCQEGPEAGCMCNEDCPTGDERPSCFADDCKGEDQKKCTVVSLVAPITGVEVACGT